jgi:glycogen operon protein
VLWFERDGAGFLPPDRYPARAVACVSTHDLPTIAGWWRGADIDEKEGLGLLTVDAAAAARAERGAERGALATALDRAGIARIDPAAAPEAAPVAAIHGFIGAAPSVLAMAQADDLAGATTALNLPATDRARPNWRRRIDVDVDELWVTERGARTSASFAARAAGDRG